MPALTTYRLFISHSWAYGDAYEKLVMFFNEHPNFRWSNYSVPKDDPIHDAPNQTELYNAIKDQIAPVNCVIILAGVYSSYSKWITKEIDFTRRREDAKVGGRVSPRAVAVLCAESQPRRGGPTLA